MSFIKKVFDKNIDEEVHGQFMRFGKGTYENRAVIRLQKGKDIKVSSTFEYANDFVGLIANMADAKFSGLIFSKKSLEEFFASKDREAMESKSGGLLVYNVDELESFIVKGLIGKAYCLLLNANASGIEFKCKKKLPKPGKSGEKKIDDKFCVLKADLKYWSQIREEFFSDIPEGAKKVRVSHTYEITKIVAPEGEKDYEKIRLLSKRAGKVIRKLEIDKKESKKEIEFEA